MQKLRSYLKLSLCLLSSCQCGFYLGSCFIFERYHFDLVLIFMQDLVLKFAAFGQGGSGSRIWFF